MPMFPFSVVDKFGLAFFFLSLLVIALLGKAIGVRRKKKIAFRKCDNGDMT